MLQSDPRHRVKNPYLKVIGILEMVTEEGSLIGFASDPMHIKQLVLFELSYLRF